MSDQVIGDDEVLYRRIPPGSSWFEPPDRITSANFKLKKGELGISVYRGRIVGASGVLEKPGVPAGCRVAQATAGEIRALKNGSGEPLDLDVVAVGDEHDLGHAEIRGPAAEKMTRSASVALSRLFELVGD